MFLSMWIAVTILLCVFVSTWIAPTILLHYSMFVHRVTITLVFRQILPLFFFVYKEKYSWCMGVLCVFGCVVCVC